MAVGGVGFGWCVGGVVLSFLFSGWVGGYGG